MARPSQRDTSEVDRITAALRVIGPGEPAVGRAVTALRDLLLTERVLLYAPGIWWRNFRLDCAYASGFGISATTLARILDESLRVTRGPWALFDPWRPEARQRNRVVQLPPARLMGASGPALCAKLGLSGGRWRRLVSRMERLDQMLLRRIGMEDRYVCRVLLCEGAQVLAWIGACQSERFGDRERMLLGRLAQPLRERLRLERALRTSRFESATVPVVLDHVAGAAFVLDENGAIEHANAAGWTRLRMEGRRLVDDLTGSLHCTNARFRIAPIRAIGMPCYHLAIERTTCGDLGARIEAAAARWSLTPRESQVLALLVRGETNKGIAAALGCVERTVEAHITDLLVKASAANRSSLVVRFFSEPP